jgi:hypothetical protein
MNKPQKTPNNEFIFPNENISDSCLENPEKSRPQAANGDTAVLCQNKKLRNTKKKKLTKHFLKLLQNLFQLAKQQNLKVVPFSAHISNFGLHALNAECDRRNESLTTVIHQRYSKALKYRIKRKPVFFFAMGYDNPSKPAAKGKQRIQPQCYSGLHTHGFMLVTEREHNRRIDEGQELRKAFKTFNGKYDNESFKQQEVSVTTASKIEHYETRFSVEGSIQRQAAYLAKNALQFDRYHQKNEKPYSASKVISGYDKEQAAMNKVGNMFKDFDETKPQPPKETTTTGGASSTTQPNLVLTENGLQQQPPQTKSLKQKIAEWNEQLRSSDDFVAPIPNNDKKFDGLDDLLD